VSFIFYLPCELQFELLFELPFELPLLIEYLEYILAPY